MSQFKKVALGGTFDRLHKGHEELLNMAFTVGDLVVVGVTNDAFPQKKELANIILPYEDRVAELNEYFTKHQWGDRGKIVTLNDIYGPTLEDNEIEGLVVTQQTYSGAKFINSKRLELGKAQLPIKVAELIKDDEGLYISSTRIRKGMVNRLGNSYKMVFSNTLEIDQAQKDVLKSPMGTLYKMEAISHINDKISKAVFVACVGDISTELFCRNNWSFDVAVFDNKVQKNKVDIVEPLLSEKVRIVDFRNDPGTINKETADFLGSLDRGRPTAVRIAGEEDLLALPLLLLLPLNSLIVYGQPGTGVVVLEVTEIAKEKYRQVLLNQYRV